MGHTLRLFGRRLRHRLCGEARIRVEGGFFLHVPRRGDEVITPVLVHEGRWEPQETRVLLDTLQPCMTFVDVGANLGYYSVLASRRVGPQGKVLALEPAPRTHRLLTWNLADNGCRNAEAHQVALADREGGRRELVLSKTNPGDHHLAGPAGGSPAGTRTVSVPLITLDRILAGRRVDVLKLDTQGAEAGIFRGMRATLAANPGLVVVTEFWPHGLRRAGSDPWAFLGEIRQAGFGLELILDDASGRPAGPGESPLELLAPGRLPELTHGERFVNLVLRR
ncbi:MAG: FkbM family methyltransferase [Planctomycetota bacterium]